MHLRLEQEAELALEARHVGDDGRVGLRREGVVQVDHLEVELELGVDARERHVQEVHQLVRLGERVLLLLRDDVVDHAAVVLVGEAQHAAALAVAVVLRDRQAVVGGVHLDARAHVDAAVVELHDDPLVGGDRAGDVGARAAEAAAAVHLELEHDDRADVAAHPWGHRRHARARRAVAGGRDVVRHLLLLLLLLKLEVLLHSAVVHRALLLLVLVDRGDAEGVPGTGVGVTAAAAVRGVGVARHLVRRRRRVRPRRRVAGVRGGVVGREAGGHRAREGVLLVAVRRVEASAHDAVDEGAGALLGRRRGALHHRGRRRRHVRARSFVRPEAQELVGAHSGGVEAGAAAVALREGFRRRGLGVLLRRRQRAEARARRRAARDGGVVLVQQAARGTRVDLAARAVAVAAAEVLVRVVLVVSVVRHIGEEAVGTTVGRLTKCCACSEKRVGDEVVRVRAGHPGVVHVEGGHHARG
mmetsp:Transcript_46283/g.142756  ORF Transcript_46283/g.142756 Transcript_46283/m.142756 type:complete len:471 (-) Transcript_46283:119-1531(-)